MRKSGLELGLGCAQCPALIAMDPPQASSPACQFPAGLWLGALPPSPPPCMRPGCSASGRKHFPVGPPPPAVRISPTVPPP